jgi:hypothetical protein
MPTKFREVAPYTGVDENLPSGGQGIVVPSGGSTLVILQDGKGLKVQSTLHPKVRVYEFTTNHEQSEMAKKASNPSEAKQRLGDGSWRIFRIEADAPVEFDKVKVEAKNTKAKGKVEATLKVLVVDKKPVKVHIRPVHVHNGKEFVPLGNAANPQKLLDEMNAIWIPQANIHFELGRTDPAKIAGLSPQSQTIEMQKLPKGFLDEQDSNLLTFFLVPKVTNGKTHDKGATYAKERVALIAESRSDSTMAHEAGHYLGSLSEGGQYSSEYGHPEKTKDMLMHEYHTGKKIPYSAVPNFNYGYHSRKK